ncbi:MAG: hypothetical protein AAF773_02900 [Cyanobacteria bacterium P01_D01_bin.115]
MIPTHDRSLCCTGIPATPDPGLGVVCGTRSNETQWSGVAPNIQLPVVILQRIAVENNTLMSPVLAQAKCLFLISGKTVKLVLENHNSEANPVGPNHKLLTSHD